MFRVFSCLTGEHDLWLVALAGIVCLLASLVAISLFHRARETHGRARAAWLALAGAATGCGIWATHFIAILAYEPSVPVAYGIELTLLSLAAAALVTFCGLAFAARSGSARWPAVTGGAIIGAGIAVMHYLGMWALELPGRVTWSLDLVLASIGFGMALGACAMAVAIRRSGVIATLIAAVLLTLAIVSHHFTAMGAVTIIPDPARTLTPFAFSEPTLALAIAAAALAVLGMSLIGAIADSYLSARAKQFARSKHELISHTAEKLDEQHIRLDTALNNMTQGLCMFDASERVVVFNRRFLEMYKLSPQVVRPGCTLGELIQHRKQVGLLDTEPAQYLHEIRESIARGETSTRLVQSTDGRVIQAFNQPMPGGGWVTTHEDVTERRNAENQLREQKLQLDAALNNMSQGLLMFDSQARLVLCNQRYLQMYDLAPDDVKPGCTLQDLLRLRQAKGTFRRDPDAYVDGLRASLAEGTPITLTADLADGRTISVINRPMPDGRWISTHLDITEARRAEERVREQKLQLDTALNNMTQGLNLFDTSGRLVVCNERYLEMYRLSADSIKPGSTIEDLVQARIAAGTFFAIDPEKYAADLMSAVKKRLPTKSEMELTDGRIVAVISQPTPDGHGWVVTHEDITERRRTEKERDRSQAFAATVIENVPAAIMVKDAHDWRYLLANRACEEYLGIPRDQIIGKVAAEFFDPKTAEKIEKNDQEILSHRQTQFHDEHPVTTPGGNSRIVTTSRTLIRDSSGEPQYVMTVIEDRTHRKRAEAQIAHMEHHDALTGLPNRAAFNECLDSTLEAAAKDDASFALLCLDLDRFKEINDVFGSTVGDGVLREVSRRLQETAGGAFVARLGGDEFTVVATDGEQPAAAEALASKILSVMAEEFVIGGQRLRTGVSIGIVVFPVDGSDAATLIANANAALDRTKDEGRGAYRFFEADMDKRLRERRVLQQELQTAIERGELVLHYQPQAKINGEFTGFEALVRWQHPTRGLIPPGTFIPLAEESGLIVAMGEWILREACQQAAAWPKPLRIAINLSPVQFRHGDLPGLVHSVLLETGLSPQRLELEITEGVLIGDFSRAVSILRRLKALGVRIAMDDFGTGYSSLSYLQSFPFDKIKIDQAFISNVERNQQSATIIRAVIGLARGLNLPVVAEGVETKEQLDFLSKESCNEIQGFLIGRPQPIEYYAALTGSKPAKILAAAS